jgi:hypothetical protein
MCAVGTYTSYRLSGPMRIFRSPNTTHGRFVYDCVLISVFASAVRP